MFCDSKFNDLLESNLSRELWKYLNEHDSIIKMETAVSLKKPSVEPLQDEIINKFDLDKHPKVDRYKQLIGAMVKYIMIERGYCIDKRGLIVKTGNLFNKAIRFKKGRNINER